MKLNHKKILTVSFIGMIGCYLTAFAIDGGKNSSKYTSNENYTDNIKETVNKTFENVSNVSLDISTPQANVNVDPTENNEVSITVSKKYSICDLDIKNVNGNISLKYGDKKNFSVFDWDENNHCDAQINISVPKNSSVTVKTVSGEIKVNGNYPALQMTSVSGNIKYKGLTNTALLNTVSGDINIEGMSKHLVTKSVSGDIKIAYYEKPIKSDLSTKSVSGSVSVHMPKDSELNYKFHSVSGAFRTNEMAVKDNANFFINSTSVSGDVTINSAY